MAIKRNSVHPLKLWIFDNIHRMWISNILQEKPLPDFFSHQSTSVWLLTIEEKEAEETVIKQQEEKSTIRLHVHVEKPWLHLPQHRWCGWKPPRPLEPRVTSEPPPDTNIQNRAEDSGSDRGRRRREQRPGWRLGPRLLRRPRRALDSAKSSPTATGWRGKYKRRSWRVHGTCTGLLSHVISLIYYGYHNSKLIIVNWTMNKHT